MRQFAVSVLAWVALGGCRPAAPAVVHAPPPLPPRPPALAVAADALARLEASPTLDGPLARDVAPTPSATLVVVFASWCEHCRNELAAIDALRPRHPRLRVIGANYRAHEEYDGKGDAAAVRAFVAAHAPWLVVVPVDEDAFAALGRPPKVPTIYVYDRAGQLVRVFDRRTTRLPTTADLDALLTQVGG